MSCNNPFELVESGAKTRGRSVTPLDAFCTNHAAFDELCMEFACEACVVADEGGKFVGGAWMLSAQPSDGGDWGIPFQEDVVRLAGGLPRHCEHVGVTPSKCSKRVQRIVHEIIDENIELALARRIYDEAGGHTKELAAREAFPPPLDGGPQLVTELAGLHLESLESPQTAFVAMRLNKICLSVMQVFYISDNTHRG